MNTLFPETDAAMSSHRRDSAIAQVLASNVSWMDAAYGVLRKMAMTSGGVRVTGEDVRYAIGSVGIEPTHPNA